MSTLEKTINLLNGLPEREVAVIYSFVQFLSSQHKEEKITDMTGKNNGADYIITNNLKDYAGVPMPALTPVAWIEGRGGSM